MEHDPKKILIINYYWPPSGGSAVQRWLSFSNNLIRLGYEPIILTVNEDDATWPFLDKSLVAEIHPKTKVFKSRTKELFWIYKKFIGKGTVPSAGFSNETTPGLLQKIARFIRGNFFYPDPRKAWNKTAIPAALKLIENYQIKIIATAGPPHSTHFIGEKIKLLHPEIKWIADFHDAWTNVWYYDKFYKTLPVIKYEKYLERRILERADTVLTVGEYLRNELIKKSDLIQPEKIHVLSMGYDDEIESLESQPSAEEFIITYSGTIDVTYKPDILFRVIIKMKREFGSNLNLKIRFVGLLSPIIKKQIRRAGLSDILIETGYVTHSESIKFLKNSTMLLLVSPNVKSEQIIIPGKLYEYLAAKKPIINIGDTSSNTAKIIATCNAGINVSRNADDKLFDYLITNYKKWGNNHDLDLPEHQIQYQNYRRSNEAKKLASIIRNFLI